MANLSKIKREKMIKYLEKLKEINNDDENIRAITEIENALNEKKYGLVWEEHSEKVDEMLEHNIPIFVEDEKRKILVDEEEEYNFLLEGDNLHSLKLLEKTHKGKIDVIYIDPPYNTGNKDFVYDDSFIDKTDGYAHSKWLSFMEKRLVIARELLSTEGVIFISIDDNEQAQLKLLCDEIFGEDNFIANIVVESGGVYGAKTAHKNKTIIKVKDYCLSYLKIYNNDTIRMPLYDKVMEPFDSRYGFYIIDDKVTPFSEYITTDNILKNGFKKYSLQPKKNNINKLLLIDDEIRKYFYEEWANKIYKDSQFTLNLDDDLIGKLNCGEIIKYKNYILMKMSSGNIRHLQCFADVLRKNDELENNVSRTIVRGDLWKNFSKDMGNVAKEGIIDFKNGKKPVRLISQLNKWANRKNSIVLDFFAGSGTTGHAVMQLNKEDGGNRKYILCTNNENNICEEVTYKRLKNIQKELPHNLKYYKTDFIPKFSDTEESISDKMMKNIKELIELEYAIEIDEKKYIIVNDEDKLDEIISKIENDGKLFMSSGIFLSRSNQRILEEKRVNIIEIPEYYFRDELKEVGEL